MAGILLYGLLPLIIAILLIFTPVFTIIVSPIAKGLKWNKQQAGILLALLVFAFPFLLDAIMGTTGAMDAWSDFVVTLTGVPPDDGDDDGAEACDYEPDVLQSGYNGYTFATVVNEYSCHRPIGTVAWTCTALGTAWDANPYTTYEAVIAGNDSVAYYGQHHEIYVGCTSLVTEDEPVYSVMTAGDVTEVILNSNGQVNGLTSANQTMTAGTTKTISIEVTGDADTMTSNPFCQDDDGVYSILMVTYNDTEYESVESAELGTSVTCPDRTAVAQFDDICFELPYIGDTTSYAFHITFEVNDDYGGTGYINGSIYDAQYYINADNNNVFCDVEDEDDNSVGLTVANQELFQIFCASS